MPDVTLSEGNVQAIIDLVRPFMWLVMVLLAIWIVGKVLPPVLQSFGETRTSVVMAFVVGIATGAVAMWSWLVWHGRLS